MIVFNAMELMALPGLFPAKGTIQDNIAVKGIREKCDLTETDLLSIGYKVEQLGEKVKITFSPEKAKALTKSISFSANEIDLLKSRISEMDQKKDITERVLDVALRIRDTTKEDATAKELK
jgi:hypothetical protein